MILFLFTSTTTRAQCAWLSSNLGCQVDGTVDIYTYQTPPNGPCNTTACQSIPFTLSPGGVLPINCTGCSPVCNIVVTVTDMNGASVTPSQADFNTGIPPGTGLNNTSAACSSSGSADMGYDPATKTFKLYQ